MLQFPCKRSGGSLRPSDLALCPAPVCPSVLRPSSSCLNTTPSLLVCTSSGPASLTGSTATCSLPANLSPHLSHIPLPYSSFKSINLAVPSSFLLKTFQVQFALRIKAQLFSRACKAVTWTLLWSVTSFPTQPLCLQMLTTQQSSVSALCMCYSLAWKNSHVPSPLANSDLAFQNLLGCLLNEASLITWVRPLPGALNSLPVWQTDTIIVPNLNPSLYSSLGSGTL